MLGARVKAGEVATVIKRCGTSKYTGEFEYSSLSLFNSKLYS
jgi:hypothetical protein